MHGVIDTFPPLPDPLKTLETLRAQGLGRYDVAALRFTFDAPNHRAAAALASDLGQLTQRGARVRPTLNHGFPTGRWTVVFDTPSAPLVLESVFVWEIEMHVLQRTHGECSLVGWQPLVDDD